MELRRYIREMPGKNRCDLSSLLADRRVLIVDDWAETGAQLRAASELCSSTGATIVGAAVLNADPVVRQRPPNGIRVLHAVIAY